ncbi:MAG: glycoside hydrolase family 3 C-terminal domain-containing protein [Clostridiales bacterium]|nr:glycoside hydrolase family 3 C-terminal domain-containing protein [Clostridiales bacterium]
MAVKRWIHSGTLNEEISEREIAHRKLAKEAASEGIVLLINEGILPLKNSTPIALFGAGAEKTVKGGIGSGDVNNRENISIYRGLKEAGISITSETWLTDYLKYYDLARNKWKDIVLNAAKTVDNPFDAYAENPFVMPEGREINDNDIKGAGAVIYVISRISGEGKDRRRIEGDYYLSKKEQEDISYLDKKNIPIILILNAGGPIELTDLLQKTENIQAVLNVSQLGQEGGYAVADVLLGKVVPSGKLTATWAKRYNDYPYAEEYSYLNGNLNIEEYKEGIYVGYRYFDSFGVEPLFPFGYGLSYTTFDIRFEGLRIHKENIELEVEVKNTGKLYSGKEVVQVYVTLPQNEIEKEYHRLIGFAKTHILQPKETQKITIKINQKEFASFSEQQHAWMIEEGRYGIWIGNSSVSLKQVAGITVSEQVVLERTNAVEFEKKAPFEDLSISSLSQNKQRQHSSENDMLEISFVPQKEEKQFYQKKYAKDQTVEELIPLLYGNITKGTSTLGSAGIRVPGSAGETTEELEEKYGIPSLIMADGPAGLRLRQSYEVDKETDTVYGIGVFGSLENGFLEPMEYHENADIYYQYCTTFPVGTALAQTWNVELMQKFGGAIAVEMKEFYVDLWLAPGMNIQRNPLCGRNFEYYSEDPFLSGSMAAAVTKGVQSTEGCGVTIKHFACNNQEDNRMGVDAHVSERALREIYLKGFEIAVKQSEPVAIMSSYNLINGVHAANSKDLCTVIAREEWGFNGVIMSDWNTTVPEDGSIPWKCVGAGNDIIMPGNREDDENIREAYKTGKLSEEEIRECAGRILEMVNKLKK